MTFEFEKIGKIRFPSSKRFLEKTNNNLTLVSNLDNNKKILRFNSNNNKKNI